MRAPICNVSDYGEVKCVRYASSHLFNKLLEDLSGEKFPSDLIVLMAIRN